MAEDRPSLQPVSSTPFIELLSYSFRSSPAPQGRDSTASIDALDKPSLYQAHDVSPSPHRQTPSVASLRRIAPPDSQAELAAQALAPVDGGKGAWLFVASAFVLETMIWGYGFTFGIIQVYLNNHPPFNTASIAAVSSIGTVSLAIQYIIPVGIILIFRRCVSCCPRGGTGVSHDTRGLNGDQGMTQVPGQGANDLVDRRGCFEWEHAHIELGYTGLAAYLAPGGIGRDVWGDFICSGAAVASGMVCGEARHGEWYYFRGNWSGGLRLPVPLFVTKLPVFLRLRLTIFHTTQVGSLLEKVGFPWTIRIWAFFEFVAFSLALMTLKPRLPVVRPTRGEARGAFVPLDLSFLLSPIVLIMCATSFISSLSFFPVSLYIPTYTVSLTSPLSANVVLAVYNAASVFGQVAVGWFSDRYSYPLIVGVIGVSCSLTAFFSWGYADTLGKVFGFVVLFGSFSGICSVWSAVARDVSGTNSQTSTFIFCTFAICRGFASIIGPIIASTLYDKNAALDGGTWGRFGFRSVTIFVGVMALVSALGGVGLAGAKRLKTQ